MRSFASILTTAGWAPSTSARWRVRKLPRTLRSADPQQLAAAASGIQATLFEKIDDRQFLPLDGHIVIRGSAASNAWQFNLARVER
jgi:hypothetical protein